MLSMCLLFCFVIFWMLCCVMCEKNKINVDNKQHQLHMLLTRLTLDVDVLVLFELPLSRSVFALVGILTLDLKHKKKLAAITGCLFRHVNYGYIYIYKCMHAKKQNENVIRCWLCFNKDMISI